MESRVPVPVLVAALIFLLAGAWGLISTLFLGITGLFPLFSLLSSLIQLGISYGLYRRNRIAYVLALAMAGLGLASALFTWYAVTRSDLAGSLPQPELMATAALVSGLLSALILALLLSPPSRAAFRRTALSG